MSNLNVAIIGIGHLGARHLKVYAEQLTNKVNVVGICDTKPDRTKRMGSFYDAPFFKDYRDLAGKVDAVNICTPTTTHHEIAKFFLQQGVHTFIEKPISRTVEEADELIDLAQLNNVKLQIGHVERYNSAFESIKHFTKDPLFIECHRLNPFPNRSLDVGVVTDLMIHDIDIILAINKCPIKSIHAVGINVLTKLEDIASVRIIFENGCVCNLTASRISEETMRKIRIFLRDTYISLDYVKQEAFIYKKRNHNILKHALPIEKEEPLLKELEHFVDCIKEDETPYVTGVEGRDALKVAIEISQQILDNRPDGILV